MGLGWGSLHGGITSGVLAQTEGFLLPTVREAGLCVILYFLLCKGVCKERGGGGLAFMIALFNM